ncbi:PP2C family protein-serine/threonine phosphatase [Oceaniglobus roseus]|uniref:PP2C family protein-serine/threonine phosphatase n=1 Tax=Oceaniglobus roseus TaxID=1737570 RepID=UPI000C7F2EA7|nr:SpoIIE family protein phosphatase [Kandeliimicrobium roseum]
MDIESIHDLVDAAGSAPTPGAAADAIERVLVVDDSTLQRRILTAMLRRWGFDVSEAPSGEAALALCDVHAFDLIICDWMMPGMSGLDFCRAFRARRQDRYVYFILLTSKSEKDEVAKGLESGADDFVTKPVSGEELRARIAAAARIMKNERELSEKNRTITRAYAEIKALYAAVDRDLNEARKLQHSLLRDRHADFGTATASFLLRSCGHVGGDLVGHFRIDGARIGLFALDVSGHGIASALLTARLAGYLSGSARDQNIALRRTGPDSFVARDLVEVAGELNEMMLSDLDTEHYFTMVLAHADLATGRVDLLQAGHPYPMVQRATGEVELVGQGGLPIGLVPDAPFEVCTVRLAPGDRLLLASDGITECADETGQMLGEDGLTGFLKASADLGGEAFFQALLWDLAAFTTCEEMADDVSGILLEYRGPPQPPRR